MILYDCIKSDSRVKVVAETCSEALHAVFKLIPVYTKNYINPYQTSLIFVSLIIYLLGIYLLLYSRTWFYISVRRDGSNITDFIKKLL